nr:hypothetical protein [Acidobacteriota bacterium]
MRTWVRAGILASALSAALVVGTAGELWSDVSPASVTPAGEVIPVPSNVKAAGVPPIPASLPEALLPYGSS